MLYLAGNYVTFSDDCKVFRVDADGDLEESEFTASTVAKDTNDRVWYHEDAGTGDVDYIVIETVEEGEAPVYNVNLTGVTLADKGNSDGKVDIRLQGTGSLANGWSVYFELIKTSKVDDDAVVDTGTFNEGGSGTVLTGYGFDSDSAGVTASETGTYKVRVTVKNADGETVATATSAESVRVTVGP